MMPFHAEENVAIKVISLGILNVLKMKWLSVFDRAFKYVHKYNEIANHSHTFHMQ